MKGKHLLVTGGAGSFGRAFVEHVLNLSDGPDLITVFSRDEHKHYEMAHELSQHADRLRFVIGDVRDAARVDEAMLGVNLVVHAAAMKHVPAGESNPFECMRTNVEGARNLSIAANRHGVERMIALSSDKAVSPSTAYGASKFAMERVLIQAGHAKRTKFSVVRYANVFASRGSVIPFFLRIKDQGVLPITDPNMTRFSITMREGIDLVLFAMSEGLGGEIIVPISPSYRVADVAMAVAPEAEHRVIGARPGEKMHEAMFSMTEAPFVFRSGKYYVVTSQGGPCSLDEYLGAYQNATMLDKPFEYESGGNNDWLSVEDIRALISTEASYCS